MKTRHLAIMSALLIVLLAVNFGFADQRTPLGRQVPCPRPTRLIVNGHNPATVLAGEIPATAMAATLGSVFSQTQINKPFGYTFNFPVCPKECCLWTTGYLTVRFKALQGGPANSQTSANDVVSIWVNGDPVVPSQNIWGRTVATGASKTSTFAIPGHALAHGHETLLVENATAVESAVLTLEGCCLCVP